MAGKLEVTCEWMAVRFVWEQGSVLLLDNMLSIRRRDACEGPRPILISLGTPGV